jgi:hypothetical protein
MAKRKRGSNKRQPRMSGPASDCLVIRDGEVVGSFTPRPRPLKRTSVIEIDGELIIRVTDL